MTREEIIDIIKSNMELDDYGNHIYYNAIYDEILSAIKHEKIELLKEFVVWLKVKYQKECEAWFEIAKEKEQAKDEWEKSKADCYFGRSYGFDRANTDLEQDLKKFLEENTNADR